MAVFEWKDLLTLSNSLNQLEQTDLDQAIIRTQISRSYYASFHTCIEYAKKSKDPEYVHSRIHTHKNLSDFLLKLAKKETCEDRKSKLKDTMGLLSAGKKLRQNADYDSKEIPKICAADQMRRMGILLSNLKSLEDES